MTAVRTIINGNIAGDFARFINFVVIMENNLSPVALCSDHAGYELKSIIEGYLASNGIAVKDFGTNSADSCDYPDFAHPAALAVESGECPIGIAMCGTGNGISMTLNKHQGIRAALCWAPELAKLAREHNNANMLAMGDRVVGTGLALEIVQAFLETDFSNGERHIRRIDVIED